MIPMTDSDRSHRARGVERARSKNAVDEAVEAVRRRQMILPALLFLAGHRPLAFLLGQMLLVLHPLAALLGADGLHVWGELFSQPTGPSALTARLALLLEEDSRINRGRGADT